jgi:coenzyme F420-0:L-glutamate ligase/coenzyme F420-1:gamma-L-glutamate ligase
MRLEISALTTLPEVRRGDDLAQLIREAASQEREPIDGSVILAVAQKIVSKAEGAVVDLRTIRPSALAESWASAWDKDPRLIELILSQSKRIVKMDRGVLIAETRHGFVCANAGVDQSNLQANMQANLQSNKEDDEFATILPENPDLSAQRLCAALRCGAVIITDTFGRPWREGLVDIAVGVAGLEAVQDCRGSVDRRGRKLAGTILAVADQLAAAAGLLMVKSGGFPVVCIRGYEWRAATTGSARALIRNPQDDLFR